MKHRVLRDEDGFLLRMTNVGNLHNHRNNIQNDMQMHSPVMMCGIAHFKKNPSICMCKIPCLSRTTSLPSCTRKLLLNSQNPLLTRDFRNRGGSHATVRVAHVCPDRFHCETPTQIKVGGTKCGSGNPRFKIHRRRPWPIGVLANRGVLSYYAWVLFWIR